ncbi:hypothetical protein Tco_1422983 [Tanacetum coccineum]
MFWFCSVSPDSAFDLSTQYAYVCCMAGSALHLSVESASVCCLAESALRPPLLGSLWCQPDLLSFITVFV